MGHAQKLGLIFLMMLTLAGRAEAAWQLTLDRTGFFGSVAAGAIYDWYENHSVEVSLGLFSMEENQYGQVNIAYRYSHWHVRREDTVWSPMQVGIFLTRSMDGGHYFRASPAKYPSADYYDQTALRGGLEFSTAILFESTHIGFAYSLRVLDSGLVAIYNNANRDLQYYISSGLALRYQF
jgi:hypothetical protein